MGSGWCWSDGSPGHQRNNSTSRNRKYVRNCTPPSGQLGSWWWSGLSEEFLEPVILFHKEPAWASRISIQVRIRGITSGEDHWTLWIFSHAERREICNNNSFNLVADENNRWNLFSSRNNLFKKEKKKVLYLLDIFYSWWSAGEILGRRSYSIWVSSLCLWFIYQRQTM